MNDPCPGYRGQSVTFDVTAVCEPAKLNVQPCTLKIIRFTSINCMAEQCQGRNVQTLFAGLPQLKLQSLAMWPDHQLMQHLIARHRCGVAYPRYILAAKDPIDFPLISATDVQYANGPLQVGKGQSRAPSRLQYLHMLETKGNLRIFQIKIFKGQLHHIVGTHALRNLCQLNLRHKLARQVERRP